MLILDRPLAFPAGKGEIRAKLAPIYIEPIIGSGERLTVGIAVIGDGRVHVEAANALRRLECLYGPAADQLKFVVEASLDLFLGDLSERGLEALSSPRPAFSSVSVGGISEASGPSLDVIAKQWMKISSSLYTEPQQLHWGAIQPHDAEELSVARQNQRANGERVQTLIYNYVSKEKPEFAVFFSKYIRKSAVRPAKRNAHEIHLDFQGRRTVANLGMINAVRPNQSVGVLKQRLWDLKVDRDNDGRKLLGSFEHELLVHYPAADDPQVSEEQFRRIEDALGELEHQADQEELRLFAETSVAALGKRIIEMEAA